MSSVANCHIAFMSEAFQAASHPSSTALTFATALLLIVGIGSPPRIERGIVTSWIGLARLLDGRGRDEDFSPPPAQIPACAANAPGSSLGSNVGGTRVDTACTPAHSRQSDRRGFSAQCPNHGRLSAVSLG